MNRFYICISIVSFIFFSCATSYQKTSTPNQSTNSVTENFMRHSEKGEEYANNGQNEQAIAELTKAINVFDGDENAFINRGLCYSRISDWESSNQDLERAIEINPDADKAYYLLGLNYYTLSLFPEMSDSLSKLHFAAGSNFAIAVSKNPENALANYWLGHMNELGGYKELAISAYQNFLKYIGDDRAYVLGNPKVKAQIEEMIKEAQGKIEDSQQ